MNSIYERIMSLPDTYEIKEIVRRWEILSDKLEKNPTKKPVILPDILMIAKKGVGKTHILNLLTEYLASKENLVSFYGDVKCFEFFVNYCESSSDSTNDFSEIRRLMSVIDTATGFRSEYRGIVCLDITEWKGHQTEKNFASLLQYISANSDYWLVVFIMNGDEKEVKEMESFLSMYLRIEKAELKIPDTPELMAYIKRILDEYGLSMDMEGEQLLTNSVKRLRDSKFFDGYKTLDMLSKDIIYHAYTSSGITGGALNGTDLSRFSEKSEYINTRLKNLKTIEKQIGFIHSEDKDHDEQRSI